MKKKKNLLNKTKISKLGSKNQLYQRIHYFQKKIHSEINKLLNMDFV